MSTKIRAELSKRNPYWIEKHRYYELKHFCMQYPIWKKLIVMIDGYSSHSIEAVKNTVQQYHGDYTADRALIRAFYSERIGMIERAAERTDSVIGRYILKGVTEGVSYEVLKTRLEIPCCKDVYYELYRKFFWLLSQERQ